MFLTLTAAISYADIAFFVILGLGLIGGLIGGLARAFKGFFKSIAIILISLLIVGVTVAPLCKIGFVQKMTSTFENKTSSWGEVFNRPVHIADDGSYYIEVEYDGTQNKVKLEDAGGSGLVDRSKAKFANWLAKRFITEENQGQTLGEAAANMLTTIIVAVIAFIVYCILLGILCWILRKLLKPLHDSDNGAVRIVDRTLGAVVAAGLAFIFLLLALAILHTFANKIPVLEDHLTSSPVCGFFYEHNPISDVFAAIFG